MEGIFRIETASQVYFRKPSVRLNRAEVAMIIACLPSSRKYSVKPMSRWVSWKYPRVLQQMKILSMTQIFKNLFIQVIK